MSNLPSGYVELEYIKSTGTQFINTNFKPNQDTRMVLKARLISISGELGFAGQRYNSSVQAFAWLSISGSLRSYYNNNYDLAGPADTEIHIYDKNKNITYIDEEQVCTATYTTFKGDFSIYLCACHDETGSVLKSSSAVYECQIYDDGTLVRNYIPCINPSSEVGLYDTVNNTFYGNAGTGNFIAGPEVVQIPESPSSVSQITAVVLSWNSVECDGYNIYKNGFFLKSTTDTLFLDSDVSDGQEIEYSITSFNSAGESDPVSISVQIKEGYTILIPIVNSAFFQ